MYIPSFLKRNTETLHIWDVGKKLCQQALEDHCGWWGQITSINGSRMGFGPHIQMIKCNAFYELSNTQLFTINEPVESISIDPVHQWLAASSHMGKVKLCSIHRDVHFYDSYKTILVFFLETGEILSCCHLSDSGTEDWHKVLKSPIGSATIYNMNGSFDLYQISKALPARNFEVPTKRKHLYVKGAALAEDGALALCGSDNGRLHLYSTLSSSKIQTLHPGGWRSCIQAVNAISSLDHKLIASSSSDKKPTIYVWKKWDQSKNTSTIGIPSFMNMLNFLAILFLFWLISVSQFDHKLLRKNEC
ncbi:hypothetical protein BDQ17DRAFT_1338988 [Cyathus striatus]|nr:hypothetical protein BDQ17DRAFT_1338988 [Cyathus striatus]